MASSDVISDVRSVLRDVEDFLYDRIERRMRDNHSDPHTGFRPALITDDFDRARDLRDRINRAIGNLK